MVIDQEFFERRNKLRNYLHLDKKLSNAVVYRYVIEKQKIEKHSFLPFISFTLNERKIKKNGQTQQIIKFEKERLINFPSHMDGNIYAFYSKKLENYYEEFLAKNKLTENVVAFRKIQKNIDGKIVSACNIHFAKEVFEYINNMKKCVVLCFDVRKFFDNLNHMLLKDCLLELLKEDRLPLDYFNVYSSLTKYSYVEKKELYSELNLSLNSRVLHRDLDRLCDIKTFRNRIRKKGLVKKNLKTKGIPQGSPISGILSNIYMMNFDKKMKYEVDRLQGHYFRYCDDIIFVINQDDKDLFTQMVHKEIEELRLKLNTKKTQTIYFEKGVVDKRVNPPNFNHPHKLQYLGILYDGENVFLRETGISKYNHKFRKAIRMRASHFKKISENKWHNGSSIYKRSLFTRFTYIGRRNYVSYAYRVASEFNSNTIRLQIKGHFNNFNDYLERKLVK